MNVMCDILVGNNAASAIAIGNPRAPNALAAIHDKEIQTRRKHSIDARIKKARSVSSESEYLHVEVRYPRTYRHEEKGKYTDYEIHIETNKIAFSRRTSTVRRRFSEFLWLRKQLASVEVNGLGKGSVPELPPKKVIGRFLPHFLILRQQGLQHFLDSVLQINKFLSYSGLHLFLQSPMSIHEIEHFLNGKYGDKTVEDMLEDFGCASNTDNPFSVFLRSNHPTGLRINRSRSYDSFPGATSNDDNILARGSVDSSDMSSGSYTGVPEF